MASLSSFVVDLCFRLDLLRSRFDSPLLDVLVRPSRRDRLLSRLLVVLLEWPSSALLTLERCRLLLGVLELERCLRLGVFD